MAKAAAFSRAVHQIGFYFGFYFAKFNYGAKEKGTGGNGL